MAGMNETPTANRFAIGLFGKCNTGKSSLINALAGQPVAVTSEVAGTTTDPVYKAMELLPIGPVVLMDTAGLDDAGELGGLRMEKTWEVLRKTDLALVVADAETGLSESETGLINELVRRKIPGICVLNKSDLRPVDDEAYIEPERLAGIPVVRASARTGMGIEELKKQIIASSGGGEAEPSLVRDLVKAGDMAVLVTPIDKSAPKGRLILPQQQVIRDIIDSGAMAAVSREHELKALLARLAEPPAIVITDSQAFAKVSEDTPDTVPLTSFSILFARQKADLAEMTRGAKRIEKLKPGDKVLIAEGCTHHRQEDDIGRVKIPRWLSQAAGGGLLFEWASGAHFPKDIEEYALIVHCGGCMLNRREMGFRVETAREKGVHITNYGVLIAYLHGILPRALRPFPEARLALED